MDIRYDTTSQVVSDHWLSHGPNYNRLMYRKVIDFAFFWDISFRKIVSYWDLSDLASQPGLCHCDM
jgi:hypothetical protein